MIRKAHHLESHDAMVNRARLIHCLRASASCAAQAHHGRAEDAHGVDADHVDGVSMSEPTPMNTPFCHKLGATTGATAGLTEEDVKNGVRITI